jgi:hypothetical protein
MNGGVGAGIEMNQTSRGFSSSTVGIADATAAASQAAIRTRGDFTIPRYAGAAYDAFRARTSRLIPGVY